MELLSVLTLQRRIEEMRPEVFPPPSTDRYAGLPSSTADRLLDSGAQRFPVEPRLRGLDSLIKEKCGISGLYRSCGGIDWALLLRDYLKGVWHRSETAGYYAALKEYITILIRSNDSRHLLANDFPYHLSTEYPYREKIIHGRTRYEIGRSLLTVRTAGGETVLERLAMFMVTLDDRRRQQEGLSALPSDIATLSQCLELAWEPTALLYDIGRLLGRPEVVALLNAGLAKSSGLKENAWAEFVNSPTPGNHAGAAHEAEMRRTVAVLGSCLSSTPATRDGIAVALFTWRGVDDWFKTREPATLNPLWIVNPMAVLYVVAE